jgi:hypothetical protein
MPRILPVRHEILLLHQEGHLTQSGNNLKVPDRMETDTVSSGRVHSEAVLKPNVLELDLVLNGRVQAPAEAALARAPTLAEFQREVAPILCTVLSQLDPSGCTQLTEMDQLKLQVNVGDGGCFPVHHDTSPEVSRRQLTAVLYLNPGWQPADGGHLRLYPFPFEDVDVAPLQDRLALFCSHQMLHRVMPSFAARRLCLSMWFAAAKALPFPSEPQSLLPAEERATLAFLCRAQNKLPLLKVVRDQQWARSLQEAFATRPQASPTASASVADPQNLLDWSSSRTQVPAEVQSALRLHAHEVEQIRRGMPAELFSLLMESLPLEPSRSAQEAFFRWSQPSPTSTPLEEI